MISLNELRLGSYIQVNNNHIYRTGLVKSINSFGIYYGTNDCGEFYAHRNYIHPIELNPSWLIRLGFQQSEHTLNLFFKGNILITYIDFDNGCKISLSNLPEFELDVMYVHQLQNLMLIFDDITFCKHKNEKTPDFTKLQ